ncbi:Putative small GTPase, P-loop containing nucleoside triphosphate hydrolase [Septoria linicola]|uniref:Small GTPase, P-loop containing nucleoside triphosphate hydrolase n=1 Tax=Septoria linicola TaxID=215465 RepID=A0A9Q9EH23_9PEZI|nr:Putative small GTPase, P-loop containing nucleoside triphosphate hydrolase [Septoria linicola]
MPLCGGTKTVQRKLVLLGDEDTSQQYTNPPSSKTTSTTSSSTTVDSPDSLENVESKWVGEIADNCPGVKLVLVALKCDLREQKDEDDENAGATGGREGKKELIDYKAGLAVAEKIKALRYLECSAMKNRGVNEAFTEAARVALQVKNVKGDKSGKSCNVM